MSTEREALVRRALTLEYVTVGWNVMEAVIAIAAGAAAGSIALISFGLDSCIEVTAAAAVIHRFHAKSLDSQDAAERRALRIVGGTFFLLAIYVFWESCRKLWNHEVPSTSIVGIALTSISAVWMPFLSRSKKEIATRLHSPALLADSRETLFCAILSVIVLAGLAANAWMGWWWADPVAGLVVVYFLIQEAREAWSGRGCECADEPKAG